MRQLHEVNPMLGLRMCRLGIVSPEIYAMQVRAIFEAACELRKRGIDAKPDVMIPGVGTREEMRLTYDAAKAVADAVIAETGVPVPYRIGTMIELPRACVVADKLAEIAQFFSFGTNDLTQTTFGYSRDDAEATVHPDATSRRRCSAESPFQVLDRVGVGESDADRRSRRAAATRPRPEDRHLRRARRRSVVGDVLRRTRTRLRLVFAVPRSDRSSGRRAGASLGVH